MTVSGRENYPMLLTPIGPLHFEMAHPHVALHLEVGSRHVLSTRSLNLAAIDTKLVAVN